MGSLYIALEWALLLPWAAEAFSVRGTFRCLSPSVSALLALLLLLLDMVGSTLSCLHTRWTV